MKVAHFHLIKNVLGMILGYFIESWSIQTAKSDRPDKVKMCGDNFIEFLLQLFFLFSCSYQNHSVFHILRKNTLLGRIFLCFITKYSQLTAHCKLLNSKQRSAHSQNCGFHKKKPIQ